MAIKIEVEINSPADVYDGYNLFEALMRSIADKQQEVVQAQQQAQQQDTEIDIKRPAARTRKMSEKQQAKADAKQAMNAPVGAVLQGMQARDVAALLEGRAPVAKAVALGGQHSLPMAPQMVASGIVDADLASLLGVMPMAAQAVVRPASSDLAQLTFDQLFDQFKQLNRQRNVLWTMNVVKYFNVSDVGKITKDQLMEVLSDPDKFNTPTA